MSNTISLNNIGMKLIAPDGTFDIIKVIADTDELWEEVRSRNSGEDKYNYRYILDERITSNIEVVTGENKDCTKVVYDYAFTGMEGYLVQLVEVLDNSESDSVIEGVTLTDAFLMGACVEELKKCSGVKELENGRMRIEHKDWSVTFFRHKLIKIGTATKSIVHIEFEEIQ